MKKLKIKTLIVGVLSTLLLTSTVTMAKTNNNTFNIDKNINSAVVIPPHLTSLEILGYSDGLHFSPSTNSFNDLNAKSSMNDILFWSSDSDNTATLYLGYDCDSYGNGHTNAYLEDGTYCSWNDAYYNKPLGYNTLNLDRYYIPQGFHNLKLVIVNKSSNNPSMLTDSINLRVSSLSSYNLKDSVPINQEFKYKLPKQVASNVNLANYVGVFNSNTGNQVSASVKLGSDNQTLIIDPPNGQYEKNSSYQLIINYGIQFVDDSELCAATIINFSTNDTTTTTGGTNSSLSKQSLFNFKESSLKSMNFDSNNLLNNKSLKDTSKDKSSTALNNSRKLANLANK